MSRSSWSGPVRSANGFEHAVKNSTTGEYISHTTIGGRDARRYYLEEYFSHRPGINANIDQAYTVEIARGLNRHFEVLGTNMTTALSTFDTTRGGITITTAGADEDQAIITPHLDTTTDNTDGNTAWYGVLWGTENSVQWDCLVSTNAIDNQKIWAGLKLTNDQLIATDADQAFFKFATDADNGESLTDFTLLHFVYSVANTDYISALPITVAANTSYHLKIIIDSNRQITIFVNGLQYNVTSTAGSTGGTAVTRVKKNEAPVLSTALTNDIDLIPYIGIEAGAAAAEALDVHYTGISRILFE
jgi:hypothetical protein|tara:strand:- start:4720 stop:5628 length:909 start_codon:yes stop_codon:yes gene_type:complete